MAGYEASGFGDETHIPEASSAEGWPMGAPGSEKALARIMKWAERDEWQAAYQQVLDAHLGPLLDNDDLEFEDLAGLLGGDVVALFGCATEDFLSGRFEPDLRNIIDDYLKRRGFKESVPVKRYLRALQDSVMSVYEVVETAPGGHLVLSDLVRGGEPVRVEDKRASHDFAPADRIGARLLPIGDRIYMSNAVLTLSADDAAEIVQAVEELREASRRELDDAAEEDGQAAEPVDDALLDELLLVEFAPLFTQVWLKSRLEEVAREMLAETGTDDVEAALARLGVSKASAEQGADPDLDAALATPLEALGGKSPMQAARSKAGRRQVAQWLKYLEARPDADADAGPDLDRLWQALGIEHLR